LRISRFTSDIIIVIKKLLLSGGKKFSDFSEKHMTKFHAEFPNFMQNLEICE